MTKNYDVWCPSCGCLMKLRKGKFGEFYGCTGYPQCRNTMNKKDAALETIHEGGSRDNWRD